LAKIDLHIKKEVAAIMVGDQIFRERNLIEWSKIDTTAKMSLRQFYPRIWVDMRTLYELVKRLLKEQIPEMRFGATKSAKLLLFGA
jgi:hypothetical protein